MQPSVTETSISILLFDKGITLLEVDNISTKKHVHQFEVHHLAPQKLMYEQGMFCSNYKMYLM